VRQPQAGAIQPVKVRSKLRSSVRLVASVAWPLATVAAKRPKADISPFAGTALVIVLGGLAEFERHLILSRTDEGRKRAMAKGVRFGRTNGRKP